MSKDLTVKDNNSFVAESMDMSEMFAEEMDGLMSTFDRIKIPTGGGLAFEIPGDDPNSPDMAKEIKAVILHHHPIQSYYKDKYDGSSNPPDCSSMDGKRGTTVDGEILECARCPYSKFGSDEGGKGKACKQKRRIYLLREGDRLPTLMTLPTGSLSEYSKYIMRLLNKGKKSNQVVTRLTLKKAQNSTGINYSQAIFSMDRELHDNEYEYISKLSADVKAQASSLTVEAEDID